MTDEKYVFSQTEKERKRIAKGAFHKKSGSKSKRCTLPSDRLTKKQLEERNGEIVAYNLNQPMSWTDFLKMPEDLQREYITKLASLGGRGKDIAEMMGTDRTNFSKKATKLFGGSSPFANTHQVTTTTEWQNFIGTHETPSAERDASDAEIPNEDKNTQEGKISGVKQRHLSLSIKNGTLEYDGHPDAVFTKALLALDPSQEYNIHILFTALDER